MDEFIAFFKQPYVLSIIGVIILLTSVFDVMGISILFIKMKASYGIFLLGIFHFLKGISQMFEDS